MQWNFRYKLLHFQTPAAKFFPFSDPLGKFSLQDLDFCYMIYADFYAMMKTG